MTKRIFAIVLALVMSLSILAVDVFAAAPVIDAWSTQTGEGYKIGFSWSAYPNAEGYFTSVLNSEGTSVGSPTPNGCTAELAVTAAGVYTIRVRPVVNGAGVDEVGTCTVTVGGTTPAPADQAYLSNGVIYWTDKGATTANPYTIEAFNAVGTSLGKKTLTVPYFAVNGLPYGAASVKIYFNGAQVGTTVDVLSYSGSYNGITVAKSTATSTISWPAITGASTYVVMAKKTSDTTYKYYQPGAATTCTVDFGYNDTWEVIVIGYAGGLEKGSYKATITSGSTGSSGSTNVTGNLGISKGPSSSMVTWSSVGGATQYYVYYKLSTDTQWKSTTTTSNYVTVPYGTSANWQIQVSAFVNGTLTTIGSATVPAGTGTSGTITTSALTVTKGTTNSTVAWKAVSGATHYIITFQKTTDTTATSSVVANTMTSVTVPCGSNDSWVVKVQALVNGSLVDVGSATVTPGSVSSGTSSSTVTTNGSNCKVVSTGTSSTVTWTASGTNFLVVYTETGKDAQVKSVNNAKTVTIPVGFNTSFSIKIYNMSSGSPVECASATVKASAGGSSSAADKTEIKGLELEYSGSWNTVVTWNKVAGAQFYQIDYALLNAQAGESEVTTKSTYTLPYGKNINFQVIVTAFMADGTKKNVGYAFHVAGSKPSTSTPGTTTPDVEIVEEFDTVTGFWAETLGDGHVKLTWNAVEDADNYKVYYRKVGATKWSGGHKRTKTNITIDFGSKTSTYEFKIVAGDEESTVLTLKPNAEQGTVAWAANPESDADFETNLYGEVLNADTGKIKFTWDKAKNVDEYKVYYRKAGTTAWKGGYERKSSLTITFKAENIDSTYEIKIVAKGKDSDIFTLKPAVWANAE